MEQSVRTEQRGRLAKRRAVASTKLQGLSTEQQGKDQELLPADLSRTGQKKIYSPQRRRVRRVPNRETTTNKGQLTADFR